MSDSNNGFLTLKGQVTAKTVLNPESPKPCVSFRATVEGGTLSVEGHHFDDRRIIDLTDFNLILQSNQTLDPMFCLFTFLEGSPEIRKIPDKRGEPFARKLFIFHNISGSVKLELAADKIPEKYDVNKAHFLAIWCGDLAGDNVSE